MTGRPAPSYGSGRRDAIRAALLDALVRPSRPDDERLALRTRELTDPTVALLDAWATIGDVVGFYQERIATEGYLGTATEDGSVLALAELVGVRPRPGLAASTWLAFTLNPDPADQAVELPAALVCQSVPGPGELPQAFETTAELVARPSWNQLAVRRSAPPTLPADAGDHLPQVVVQGAAPGIDANNVVLLDVGTAQPIPLRVARTTADVMAQRTTVDLLPLHGDGRAAGEGDGGVPLSGDGRGRPAASDHGSDGPPDPMSAVDALLAPLRRTAGVPPATADGMRRGPSQVFGAGGDLATRLLGVTQPTVAATLYPALASTPIGRSPIAGALVLKGRGAPFAALIPPRPVFSRSGRPLGTEDIPVAAELLGLHVPGVVREPGSAGFAARAARGGAEVFVDDPGGAGRAPLRTAEGQYSVPAGTGLPGSLEVRATGEDSWDVVYHGAAAGADLQFALRRVVASGEPLSLTATFPEGGSFTWRPHDRANVRTVVGRHRISVDWMPVPGSIEPDLTVTLEQLRPLAQRQVLTLDAVYDKILPGSTVLIDRAGAAPPSPATAAEGRDGTGSGPAITYPLARRVRDVDTVVANEYGLSFKATRLVLDGPWVGDDVVWLSQLRELSVRFQAEPVTLLPVPLGGDVGGTEIELDGLHPGIEPGRLLVVSGRRTDLPAAATAPGAEPAMVAGCTLRAGDPGVPAHTVLTLAEPLAYRYERASVVIFGNVAAARQGATIVERPVARGNDPAHPTFTLAHAPVLADPDPSAEGARLALTFVVDGQEWQRDDHLDAATPANRYLTSTDGQGRTVITLGRPVPASAEIEVSYRTGSGRQGNARAHQITQLLTRPQPVAGVDNPLPATGGSDGDPPEVVRERVPLGLTALGRLVSVADHADLARSWAGIGKADATEVSDGRRQMVALTVAGSTPQPLDPNGALVTAIKGAVEAAGDASLPVAVLAARPSLIVLAASVRRAPAWRWVRVAADLRAAIAAAFAYEQRGLGQDVLVSDFVAVAHRVRGVESFTVTALGLVPLDATGTDVAARLAGLSGPPPDGRVPVSDDPTVDGGRLRPAGLAYMSAQVPDTVVLQEVP